MMDPNDSDGSWEFVDKDSDSDTSSVASPYDTGLPDEISSSQIVDNSAWNNRDDFVTDSDIEACTDDSLAGSDEEPDSTLKQDVDVLNQDETEDSNEKQESVNDSQSSSETVTRSMILYEEENPPQTEAETETLTVETEVTTAETQTNNTLLLNSSDQIEEVTSQETNNSSSVDDIITTPVVDSEDVQVDEEQPSILSTSSSESDFERISSSNDLVTSDLLCEPEHVKETLGETVSEGRETLPKEIAEDLTRFIEEEGSDSGSVDFTVIIAPASPPVEVVSHDTTTGTVPDDEILTNQRSIGIVTEIVPTNQNMVDKATEPFPTNQRTVGMVTDHIAQPNQRLLISIMMISFGVGFLVGRCPMPDSPTVFKFHDTVKQSNETRIHSIQELYHTAVSQSTEVETLLKETKETLIASDYRRFSLMAENFRIKSQNRGLRSTIYKIKKVNNEFVSERTKRDRIHESNELSLIMLRQSCQKLQRINEKEIEIKNKELRQLETRVKTSQQESSFLNTSMSLYRRLQSQQAGVMKLYTESVQNHKQEKSKLLERQESMKLKLQRYRYEIKNLLQDLMKSKNYNSYLEMLVENYEIQKLLEQKCSSQDSKQISPLLQALSANQDQTCSVSSKYRSQVKQLKVKVRGQNSLIRKYEQEANLKSTALEMLYTSMQELNNYASCLKQQILKKERTDGLDGVCRSATKSSTSKAESLPQCSYQVRGTLAIDLTGMNTTVKNLNEGITNYNLKIMSSHTLPALFFDVTPMLFNLSLPTCKRPHVDHSYLTTTKSSTSKAETPKSLPQCSYQVNGTLAIDLTSMNISVKNLNEGIFNYNLKIMSSHTLPALFFDVTPMLFNLSLPTCKRPHVDHSYLTSDPKIVNYIPAVLYAHAVMKSVRAQRNLMSRKAEFLTLYKVCAARNQTLDVTRKEVENVENRLVVAKQELKRLRMEKKYLNQKLRNVTSELEKKPSMKQCLNSALDTKELLKQVNGTKAFKNASKMAKKLKKATDKAWHQFTKFVKKFSKSDFDGDHTHSKQQHRDSSDKRNKADRKRKMKNANHHEFAGDHRYSRQHHRDKGIKAHKNVNHGNRRKNHKSKHEFGENSGSPMRRKKHIHHEVCKFKGKEITPRNFPRTKTNGENEQKNRNKNERLFSEQNKIEEKKYKNTKFWKGKKCSRKHHIKQQKDQRQQTKQHSQRRQASKPIHHVRDVIEKQIETVKDAGKKVVTQLMPIYNKWEEMYCNIEKNFLPKSLSKIWETLSADSKTTTDKVKDDDAESKKKISFLNMDLGWELYQNFTDIIIPVINLPGKLKFSSWGIDWQESDVFVPAVRRNEIEDVIDPEFKGVIGPMSRKSDLKESVGKMICFKEDTDVVAPPPGKNPLKDPQWFSHMFKLREDLRKDWGDSPLSEEEFDWFLKMFEAREELRQSGDGYPSNHGNENNKELDWFLKMFEARARLRFENTQEETNWYLKLSEARNKARSEVNTQNSKPKEQKNWFTKMSEARENLRKHDGDWFVNMAEGRKKARKRWSAKKNGDWFLKRMKLRQKTRDKDSDKRKRRTMVHNMNTQG